MANERTGPGCEVLTEGFLQEPVSAITSLAFVVAAGVILLERRHPRSRQGAGAPSDDRAPPRLDAYPLLVAGIGIGSVIQHGPDPAWSDLVHDLPLAATLALVAADAVADLLGRSRAWWWWALPTTALVPLIVAAPRAGDLAQAALAAVAVVLTVVRARERPRPRRRIGWSLALLAVGSAIGTLSRAGGPLCDPGSLWQGHAVWHVLASAALVVLGPVVGQRAGSR